MKSRASLHVVSLVPHLVLQNLSLDHDRCGVDYDGHETRPLAVTWVAPSMRRATLYYDVSSLRYERLAAVLENQDYLTRNCPFAS